jgi:predicted ATP-dependent serine protease
LEQRIREAEKLGFRRIIIPAGQKVALSGLKIELLPVKRVADAFRILIKK